MAGQGCEMIKASCSRALLIIIVEVFKKTYYRNSEFFDFFTKGARMSRMRTRVLGLTVGVVCFVMALVAAAQDAKVKEGYLSVPVKNIDLKPPEGVDATKNPVTFPHSRHFIYNCRECHHTWNLDVNLKTCTASECHDQVKAPKKEDAAAPVPAIKYFKNAFHQQCIGCHQEIKKQNTAREKGLRLSDKDLTLQKTGPTGCVECHPRD